LTTKRQHDNIVITEVVMKVNEYSKEEIKSMIARGIVGVCSVCGGLEPTNRKWPYHNMILCSKCRVVKERKENERIKRGL
jgi:hypothetical protein